MGTQNLLHLRGEGGVKEKKEAHQRETWRFGPLSLATHKSAKPMALDPGWECRCSPGHTDAGIQVIQLGGAQGNLLVFFLVGRLHLQLGQLLLHLLDHLLFLFHSAASRERGHAYEKATHPARTR